MGEVADENGPRDEVPASGLRRVLHHPWTQILLISFICFCLPGVRQRFFEYATTDGAVRASPSESWG